MKAYICLRYRHSWNKIYTGMAHYSAAPRVHSHLFACSFTRHAICIYKLNFTKLVVGNIFFVWGEGFEKNGDQPHPLKRYLL